MPTGAVAISEDIEQVGFQIFNDDGGPTNVNNATAKAGANAGASAALATKARVRVKLLQFIGASTNYRYLLEYRTNGGAWGALDAATSVRISTSTAFTDAQATAQRIGSEPFVAGEGLSANRNSAAIALNSGGGNVATEIEWNVLLNSGAVGDVIQFRVVAMTGGWTGGAYTASPLGVYSVYPQITLGVLPPSVERASVFEGLQIGLEGTPGVPVGATQRILSFMMDTDPHQTVKPFTPQGYKYPTTVTQEKEWTDFTLTGTVDFNHILYLFSSLLTAPTISTPATNGVFNVALGAPSAGNFTLTFNGQATAAIAYNATAAAVQAALEALSTITPGNVYVQGGAGGPYSVTFQNALETTGLLVTGSGAGLTGGTFAITTIAAANTRRWTFLPSSTQPDTPQALTVEKGSAAGAAQMAFAQIIQLALKFSPTEASLSGSGFGRTLTEPFSMTPSVPELPETPGDPKSLSVYLGNNALNTPRLTRCDEVEWEVGGRFNAKRTLNESDPSFSYLVEATPSGKIKIALQHNSDAIGYLQKLRSSTTQFLRIVLRGAAIEAGFRRRLAILCPIKLLKAPRGDKDGVYESTFEAVIAHDRGFGRAVYAEVDVDRTAL